MESMMNEVIEDLDVDLEFDYILCSDFQVKDGVFLASAVHRDLTTHLMVFNEDEKTVLDKVGPMVNGITEYPIRDAQLLRNFGPKISDALNLHVGEKDGHSE
jgi:hypothetical protein